MTHGLIRDDPVSVVRPRECAVWLAVRSALQVGQLIRVTSDQRVPADLVMLRTHDASGTAFVRTDQLDGETDWKARPRAPSADLLWRTLT